MTRRPKDPPPLDPNDPGPGDDDLGDKPTDLLEYRRAKNKAGSSPADEGASTVNENRDKGKKTGPSRAASGDSRPQILHLNGKLHRSVDEALELLPSDPALFQRGKALVVVRPWDKPPNQDKTNRRSHRAPFVDAIDESVFRVHLSRLVDWQRWDKRTDKPVPRDVPSVVLTALYNNKQWPGVPHLTGLTSCPMIRSDGSISTSPGYDPETGFYYVSDGKPVNIPTNLSQDDSRRGMALLTKVVEDFPFATDLDKYGWVAGVLTPTVRHLIPCSPGFLFDAALRGSGKTLLATTCSIIPAGKPMAASAHVEKNLEMEKRLFAFALEGDAMVLIDNCTGAIGWPCLDGFLTSPELKGRILGQSKSGGDIPNAMTLYFTGNNIEVKGDSGRRILRSRMIPKTSRPEDRTDFHVKDLKGWVAEHRPDLLGAALAIVAGYLRAGSPNVGVTPLGSFEGWSKIVASSIVWAGGQSPIGLLADRRDCADSETEEIAALCEVLEKYDGEGYEVSGTPYPDGLTVKGMMARCARDPDHAADGELNRALLDLRLDGTRPLDAHGIGCRLRSFRERPIVLSDDKGLNERLVRLVGIAKGKKSARWKVERVS